MVYPKLCTQGYNFLCKTNIFTKMMLFKKNDFYKYGWLKNLIKVKSYNIFKLISMANTNQFY
jgi:hypothetical protein